MSDISHNKTAMIIDDDEMDQFFHQKTIRESEVFDEIISFQYADEALEYLKNTQRAKVDIIFLDINMPRMNGFEFLEAAQKEFGDNFAKIVVIMVTSSLDPRDLEKSKKFVVIRDYIKKPISVDAVQKIAELIQ